ncbi:MAG: fibrobacter succinogenes major paralogous domain-containing protein [Bacteroidales bacterium]|nr:fibrobacter succinogenes major paralogous domain-containing protein [Bacteroidales bacterium]
MRCVLLAAFTLLAAHTFVAAQVVDRDTVDFTASGTWTIPSNVTSVTLEAWGGGGGGGYTKGEGLLLHSSAGGGGGAYARSTINVTPGESMTIEVGLAGYTSGDNTSNPTVVSGGNSYVRYAGTVQVLAAGGKTPTGVNNTTGANGGADADCITYNGVAYSGGNGGNPDQALAGAWCSSGGGGGAAGVSGPGGNGGNGSFANGGAAGVAGAGNPASGNGGEGVESRVVGYWWRQGNPGESYGGGGSGSTTSGLGYNLGGDGAPGFVRIIYEVSILEVNDWKDTICSTDNFLYSPVDGVDGVIPTGTQYTWTVVKNDAGITGASDQTSLVGAITGTLTNSSTALDSVVYKVVAHYNTVTDTFNVTVVVYPEVVAGAISKDQLVCQDMVINQIVSDTDPAGSTYTTPCFWQISIDGGTTWTNIANADQKEYTPDPSVLTAVTNMIRRGYAAYCDTVYSNAVTLTNPNPLAPGSITVMGDPAGSYCFNENVSAILTANPTANSAISTPPFTYQWQESYDMGNTWTDITGETGNTYTVALNPVSDTVFYRYQVKYDTCIWMISNNTYNIIQLRNLDYTEQFDTLHVVLYYGASDTVFANLPTPTLTPAPVSIAQNFDGTTRHGVGLYTIQWKVTEDCGTIDYNQVVSVEYPPCGTTDYAEDYEGNHYPVISVGRNCWLAENLRSTKYSDGSDIASAEGYYSVENPDKDANAQKFGRLYTWYSAMNVPEGDNNATPAVVNGPTGDYIQGACPQGWAVPTQEEYAELMAAAGDASNLKSSASDTWLPGKEGVAPGISFDAPGAGFYNVDAKRYENLLAETYFWSASTGASVQQGVCNVITHSCPQIITENKMKGQGFSLRCVKKE